MNIYLYLATGRIGGPRGLLFSIFKLLAIAAAVLVCGALDSHGQHLPPTGVNDCSSGAVTVDPGARRPAVVRLGLVRGGVSIVEFPASDGVNYVFEGNPKFAAVFDSPTKTRDKSLTVIPGPDFKAETGTEKAPARITMQMRSGLIVVLEIEPVPAAAAQGTSRCVLGYRVEDVVKARAELGLVGEKTAAAAAPRTAELREVADADEEKEVSARIGRKLVDRCLGSAAPCIASWSETRNGISVGASRPTSFADDRRLVVIAVRNLSESPVTLAPGYPGLRIVTLDARGREVESAKVAPDRVFVVTPGADVPAGGFAYFAIAYQPPVAGARQRLIVTAARRDAADEPASVEIPRQ